MGRVLVLVLLLGFGEPLYWQGLNSHVFLFLQFYHLVSQWDLIISTMEKIIRYFQILSGFIGALAFILSLISFFISSNIVALYFDIIIFFTLNYYHTLMSLRERNHLNDFIPPIWFTKIGSILILIYIINHFWFAFLIYSLSETWLYSIGGLVFSLMIMPQIYLKIAKKNIIPFKDLINELEDKKSELKENNNKN